MMIRPLVPSDAAQFRTLRLEALARHPDAFGASLEEEAAGDEAAFAARIAAIAMPGAIFGAFIGETLVGTAGFFVQHGVKMRHRGRVWGVYVMPAERRGGIGRTLMEHVLAHAHLHVVQLELSVGTRNQAARTLYEHLGFAIYGVERDAIRAGGRSHDLELMAIRFGGRPQALAIEGDDSP